MAIRRWAYVLTVTKPCAVMSNPARDQAVYFAELAEKAEQYDEMVNHLKTISELVTSSRRRSGTS